jgi:flagellar hook-associated protein 3 FlgL
MISGTRARLTAEIARQSRLAHDIARGQADISTGKRIQAPSDDPIAAARVADIRRTQADQKVWNTNLDTASAVASQADGTLTGVATAIDRVRELMLSASSDTLNANDRNTIAVELRGIADDIHGYAAETDSRGYPIFPATDALKIPISAGVGVTATASRADIFGNVPTAGGPMDLEQLVRAAADAVTIADKPTRMVATTTALATIESAATHLSGKRGEQGLRAARIDSIRERLASSGLLLDEERIGLEATDVPATVARINAQQLSLEAAQAVFARVNRQTLFDLLG